MPMTDRTPEQLAAEEARNRKLAALRARVSPAIYKQPGPVRGVTSQEALAAARALLGVEDAPLDLFREVIVDAGYTPRWRSSPDGAYFDIPFPEGGS